VSRAHRCPAEIYHQKLEAFGCFGRSFEWRKVKLFKDGIGGDPRDTVVADLTSDIL
jgi:hypothetical protein